MAVISVISLIVVLGVLTVFLGQNFSPTLSLVFLGMRSQPLPLAIWILLSIAAGALTSFMISILFKFTKYFAPEASTSKSTTAPTNFSNQTKTSTQRETIPPPPSSRRSVSDTDELQEFDDWETDPNQGDDWDVEEPPQTKKGKTYSNQQPSKNVSQSNSVYSYSSQSPKNTGVGKTESIYDADYRVIIPPHKPPTTDESDQQSDDDDWDFLADEDFDDNKDKPRF